MQLMNMAKFSLVKHALIGLLLIVLTGCCDRTDSFARLTAEEIEYIPFIDVEDVDFVNESGEVHTGTYSGRLLEEFDLRAGDDEACNSKIKELLYSDLEIPSRGRGFFISVESDFSSSANLSVFTKSVDFNVVEDCETSELDISEYEKSYSFNGRILEKVLILNSCQLSSDIEVIIYSKAVGIVLVEFSNGSYLINKEVNDL